ncbi:MAG: DUF4998 domain-containing protein [Mangrovibacterium sp.]
MKRKMRNRIIYVLLGIALCWSCSDMNSLHDEYLQRGERICVSQPDSVMALPGKNRVQILYRNLDPKVAKLIVYWDFKKDSAIFEVPSDRLGEWISVDIKNLVEKQYTFDLVTVDKNNKYPSVPFSISEAAYGSSFESTLSPRKIKSGTVFPLKDNTMTIEWANAVKGMIGVELLYKDASTGADRTLFVPNDVLETKKSDVDAESVIRYRTFFLPVEDCIDTFRTAYASVNLSITLDEKIDRTKFKRWNPSGIPYRSYSGWELETIWNGNLNNPGFLAPQNSGYPFVFTFDLGQTAAIRRIKIWPRVTHDPYIYARTHAKRLKIYGSPTIDVTDDLAGWTLLGECISTKPSGDGETVTAEDIIYAKAGEEFIMTNTSFAVRYIRVDALESWPARTGDTNTFCTMELEVYGVNR